MTKSMTALIPLDGETDYWMIYTCTDSQTVLFILVTDGSHIMSNVLVGTSSI